jgi:hypothetical protein
VYAVTGGTSTPTFPGTVSCGARFGEYVVVCPSDGRTTPVTIGAINLTSRLTVWSFDYAGNVNQQVNSTPVTYDFNMHGTAPDPATVLPVTAQGGASWVDIETSNHVPVATSSCQGGLSADSDALERSTVLQVSGAGQYASTAAGAVDTSQSFSASGWYCPTAPASSGVQSLITQMAGTGSPGGALRLSTGGNAELDTWTAANSAGQESVQRVPALTANTWYFISAVYDTINRQLRITTSGDGYTGSWTTATSAAAHIAAPASQPVLLGAAGPGGSGQFTGQILNPVMTQAVLTPDQFQLAQFNFNGTTGVLK